ncbi:MAG: ATP-binding cassette domain-containing protein [Candidatus Gastranaerophilaceae bacterium]
MIQLRGVTKKYKNNYALKNVNLDIMSGEFVFITGSSGAGKSTLMKLLYKEETPTTGSVMIGGINIANLPSEKVPNLEDVWGLFSKITNF